MKLFLFCTRILSTPKARTILVNGAVRKGERLVPPSAFEILIRVTFPASSARVKVSISVCWGLGAGLSFRLSMKDI